MATDAFQGSRVKRFNKATGKLEYVMGAPMPGDTIETSTEQDDASQGGTKQAPSANDLQNLGQPQNRRHNVRSAFANTQEGKRILKALERMSAIDTAKEEVRSKYRNTRKAADDSGVMAGSAPAPNASMADMEKYQRQLDNQIKNRENRKEPAARPKVDRRANPFARSVGKVTKVETTDGKTLWNAGNREDADMTGQERQGAVESRRVAANRGDAFMHQTRRSLGKDGQIRTTSDGGPKVTKNSDGSQTASGIYGTVTTKTPTNKQNETAAVMTSPVDKNNGRGPVQRGMTASYVSPNPQDIKYTDQSITSRANRELGMTPSKPDAFTRPTPPAAPSQSPTPRPIVAQAQKTGEIPPAKVGSAPDISKADPAQIKGYNQKLPSTAWENIAAAKRESERQFEASPAGVAKKAEEDQFVSDLTYLPRKAMEVSNRVGQAMVDGAAAVGSGIAQAAADVTDPEKTRKWAERFGKVKKPALVASAQ